jgi:hypothetical protein
MIGAKHAPDHLAHKRDRDGRTVIGNFALSMAIAFDCNSLRWVSSIRSF